MKFNKTTITKNLKKRFPVILSIIYSYHELLRHNLHTQLTDTGSVNRYICFRETIYQPLQKT